MAQKCPVLWEDMAGPPPVHAGGTEQGDREEPGTRVLPAILSPALMVLLIHKARRLSGWFPLVAVTFGTRTKRPFVFPAV